MEIPDPVVLLVTLGQQASPASGVLLVSQDLAVELEVLGHKVKSDQWDCPDCEALMEQQVHLVLLEYRDCQDSLESEDQ